MADRTPIEWTDATWNVINGCSVVSPGCTNCYAMRLAGTRFRNHPTRQGLTTDSKAGPVWNGQVRFNEKVLTDPLRWTRPRRIFVCAHGDLFHENVPEDWLVEIYGVMIAAHHLRGHTFQILTKRPLRAWDFLTSEKFWDQANAYAACEVMERIDPLNRRSDDARATLDDYGPDRPPPGIWLGVSAEDQARADERIPVLLDTPAAVRWLSAEPLLGPVDISRWTATARVTCKGCSEAFDLHRADPCSHKPEGAWTLACPSCGACRCVRGKGIRGAPPDWVEKRVGRFTHVHPTIGLHSGLDWVVAGGESGPGARPMHPDWARQLRDQCAAAGVPFLFKQWGDWGAVCDLDTDALDDRLYHPAPARSPEASRRPRTAQLVMHSSGERFEGARFLDRRAYEGGNAAMLMVEIGKKLAGRRLDGQLHDGFPATSGGS